MERFHSSWQTPLLSWVGCPMSGRVKAALCFHDLPSQTCPPDLASTCPSAVPGLAAQEGECKDQTFMPLWGHCALRTEFLSAQFCLHKRLIFWTSKVAQWVKALAAKPEDLSSVPGTHMVSCKLSSDLHRRVVACASPNITFSVSVSLSHTYKHTY